jgi:hypothetical protein
VNDFVPQITELIAEPDNVEKIRDHIGALIKGEVLYQYELAQAAARADAKDFNLRVFIENSRPYDIEGIYENPISEPIINIMLSKAIPLVGNARIGNQKEKSTFIIDCITLGNDGGEVWDDKVASCRAWKTARVIRRILMSEQYAYLGLRGVVGSRVISSIETGTPDMDSAALAVVTARITLDVEFMELAIGSLLPIIEGIDFNIDPSNGEVIINDD